MKKIKLILTFSLFILHFSLTYGQSWVWGREGNASIKSNDFGVSVVTDNAGNSYSCGSYSSSLTFQYITLNDLNNNGFMVKYDKYGNTVWATQPINNSKSSSFFYSNARDHFNHIFLTGTFAASIGFGTTTLTAPNAPTTTIGCSVFLAMFDLNGIIKWAKQAIGASSASRSTAYGVTTDVNGNSYITGFFTDTVTFGTFTLHAAKYKGDYWGNCFLVKYNKYGIVIWAKQSVAASSLSYAVGNGIASDNKGNIYITGNFMDTVTFGTTTLYTLTTPYYLGFLAKYDTSGNLIWVKQSQSRKLDYMQSNAITIDREGNPYITGNYIGELKFGRDSLTGTPYNWNAFLMKYKKNGDEDWALQTIGPSTSAPEGMSLASDTNGHIYLNGFTNGDSIFFHSITYTTQPAQYSTFMVELDTAGNILCGTLERNAISYMLNSHCLGMGCDSSGTHVYSTGASNDSLFAGPDTLIPYGGHLCPYVLRWLPCGQESTDAVNEVKSESEIVKVFPNPFTNYTTIIVESENGKVESYLELYDVTGQKLKSVEFIGTTYTLSAEGLAKGMYFIRIFGRSATGNYSDCIGTSKIVVQ